TPEHATNTWTLTPRNHVGVARIGKHHPIELRITPTIPIPRLLFLLGYAEDLTGWQDGNVNVAPNTDLHIAMATAFERAATRATEQGLIQGYTTIEEATPVLRGRLRTDEQLQRRFGLPMPLEIRYDDYNVDTPENRILRATTDRLLRLPNLPAPTRTALHRLTLLMADVPHRLTSNNPPHWRPSRLNTRYIPALRLGELILKNASIDAHHGPTPTDGFLLNLPDLFTRFITKALTKATPTHHGTLEQQNSQWLDQEHTIKINPDLLWHTTPTTPSAAINATYPTPETTNPHTDIHQMLTYCTRLNLNHGHLIYPHTTNTTSHHHITGTNITIHRHGLDLTAEPTMLL
ncbi:restriction endonuclease, partial [Dermatophilus congolensis]